MSDYQTHHHCFSRQLSLRIKNVRPGPENLKKNGNAGFMALMVDSVNINTDINDVSQTHVDDEGQPLSADVDI